MSPILAALEAERTRLLNLTATNRLIHTQRRTTRSGRLEIVDELSEEVFRILVREKKPMTFLPARTPEEVDDEQESSEQSLLFQQPQEEVVTEGGVAARHRDDHLQTHLTSEGLQKRLLKLYGDARTLEEEQGVNILYLALGFLEWYEDERSEEKRYGPLLLIPVVLERRSVRFNFSLRFAEDEILTNLSLQEKLRREFGVELPNVPDIADLAPGQYFKDVEQAIALQPRWKVLPNDIVLWFFSFSKYLMYRDLGSEIWPQDQQIENNPLIRGLLLQNGFHEDTPLFADGEQIDEKLQPLDLVHVLDADSSQTRAIEEVRRGRNLIIQGPPGTGKSQTIANLIAAAVKDGKTVLFLAEKQAALEVVKRYLEKIRLGMMCLELHSKKANRQRVRQELWQTLQSDPPPVGNAIQQAATLRECRDRLNRHVRAIHAWHEPSCFSAYRVIGELVRLRSREINYVDFQLDAPTTWSWEQFSTKAHLLADLAASLQRIGNPQGHCWRGVEVEAVFPADIGLLATNIQQVMPHLDELIRATEELADLLTLSPAATASSTEQLMRFAERLVAAPPMDRKGLGGSVWDECRQQIDVLVHAGHNLHDCQTRLNGIVAEVGWTTDVSQARIGLATYGRSWFRMFRRPYREAVTCLHGILAQWPPGRLQSRLLTLDTLIAGQKACRIIEDDTNRQIGHKAFGKFWQGVESDWQALAAIATWEAETRAANAPASFRQIMAGLEDTSKTLALTKEIATHLDSVLQDIQRLFVQVKLNVKTAFGVSDIRVIPLATLKSRLEAWVSNGESIAQWHAYYQRWRMLDAQGMMELADRVDRGMIGPEMLVDSFKRAYFDAILREMFHREQELAIFTGVSHNQTLERFKGLDSERIELTRHEVVAAHHQRMQGANHGFLIGTPPPLRRLIAEHGDDIQKIKPVFMMSPISVAQFLEPGKIEFDLLLIDEASQVRPEDALGAVARSKQMVIVGDDKQLPPTAFFDTLLSSDDGYTEEFPADNVDSILELGMRQNLPQPMLRWHYRSRHHSLIAVSNHEFYDDRLYIPINPEEKPTDKGLRFRHVPDGIYDRGGSATNRREAQVVADAVMDHARTCPDKTLGVGAFSISQRNAIIDELEVRRGNESDLEPFFSTARPDPFFVKNLESIQGDERDVIFISVGYGKDQNGHMTMNFGPLSAQNGERRLNVLITRARERCEVFSSITADDINIAQATGSGPSAFKTFLKYAQTGRLETVAAVHNEYDSEFEKAVGRAIEQQGYQVHSQVGVAGFFIDLAVVDPEKPGRYLLGIECDGASYHSSLSARDRDRLRQEVLEKQGWIIHRIWSTDWFNQPENQLRETMNAIELAKIKWITHDLPPESTPPPESGLSPPPIAASPAAEGETEEEQRGQPWQMTRAEFHESRVLQGFANPTENSRLYWQEIKKAIADGKQLYPCVLREYEQLFGSSQRH
jgi:very-short-patch-repair endonuclease